MVNKIKETIELNDDNYLPRDISWMFFNYRILKEAEKKEVPIYERLTFLGIYSSNLDEFYKVRVASLKRIAESRIKAISTEKKEAITNLEKIYELNDKYTLEYEKCKEDVFHELSLKGIHLVDENNLTPTQKEFAKNYFLQNVACLINPIILTKKADLSKVNDSHIYLASKLIGVEKTDYALIPLPVSTLGRFVVLPSNVENQHYVIYLDDIVRMNARYLFIGKNYTKIENYSFKFSKDAEMEIESDPEEGLVKNISQAIKDRKKGMPVRVIFDFNTPDDLKNILIKRLDVDDLDLVSTTGKYHNNKDLMKFPRLGDASLSNKKWVSIENNLVIQGNSLIEKIKKEDMMIHVPYESFDTFIRFLQECAVNKDVSEIKATIYRAANNSQVVNALIAASQNGKKVTCMVELLARFNESSNISISQTLLDAGVNVLTGAEGFKIHGKVVFVKLKNGSNLAVVSTGNFHEGNAKTYTDCLLFTANKKITNEVNNIFNIIEKPYIKQVFRNLLVSPNYMFSVFKRLILREIQNHKNGLPSGIKIKINHITDKNIIQLLYLASKNGVKIDLLVRGNCSIIPNIKGLSDNITIHAIIDRYLEHSRIFIFENAGNKAYFMGSADWMPRNLYNRIEIITPIYNKEIQKELQTIVDYGLQDNYKASVVEGNDKYIPYKNDKELFQSQKELYEYYLQKNNFKN